MKKITKKEMQTKLVEQIHSGVKSINWMPENVKTLNEIKAWVNTLGFNTLRILSK